MALAVVELIHGRSVAEGLAFVSEYVWNDNADNDPFAVN
ncbi:hypothetical protein LMG29542_07798 [Paraburkholderia humisilvae]|uniref:DJ-1/PfpI domain-containing protein n=2 Tax=Paraburkholderia humisilvae TaxID=627669 RepID=A0A6J5F6C3_9BURK|nr:hypothetical protein LMG29542_07798 [Paraburkholderia humisilvae]